MNFGQKPRNSIEISCKTPKHPKEIPNEKICEKSEKEKSNTLRSTGKIGRKESKFRTTVSIMIMIESGASQESDKKAATTGD